jgi:hypothetical protein
MVLEEVSAQSIGDLGVNTSELYSGLWDSVPPEIIGNLGRVTELAAIVLLVTIAYFAVLLIIKLVRFFFGSKESRVLVKINSNLEEILGLLRKGRHKEGKGAEKKKDKKKK